MSNQTEWRWADPTGQQRLVREDELRSALATGVIPANAPVWTRGFQGWKPAHDVPELNGKTPSPPPTNGNASTGPAEPPPPPRYVPLAVNTQPQIPKAPNSDTMVDAVVISDAPTQKATPAKPKTTPPPLPPKAQTQAKKTSAPPPLPPGARKPTPAAMAAVKPSTSAPATATSHLAKTAPSPGTTTKPIPQRRPQAPQSVFTKTERPPMGVAPPPEVHGPASSRTTLQIAPAPPPMPKIETPKYEPPKEPSSKYPTLMGFGDEPGTTSGVGAAPSTKVAPPSSDETPPIVVPPPEPSEVKNAVTRPPPWGEGAVQMDTTIPKSPPIPSVSAERPSEAPPARELSSSDLTSEARIEVVKAPPLIAADRPRTMIGLGPDALADNRAALERAVASPPPPAPLSASDVAATRELPAPGDTEPKMTSLPSPSGAKLHDLREIAKQRASGALTVARRAYANLEERTKDKPRWVLPTVLGTGTLVVALLFMAGIKAISGSSETSPTASGSATGGSWFPPLGSSSTSPIVHDAPAKPIECSMTGASRSLAPKAVVSSGVEVSVVGSQLALGFAITPKEATLELLDAASLASASALHLRSNDSVRRVVALDASKAAVDADRKGDKLQGRRTIRGTPPIDLGASDGGLAWAPHQSDKAIKLWSLQNPDAPVESLRGEALPNGKGYAVAFRHAGAIFFGAFGGNPPAPLAGLVKVDGLGPVIGSPTVAASGDRVMVAWADRAGKEDPWMVRWAMFHPGESSATPKPFGLPPGGLGDQVMSPSLASLGGGRFLIVWTEGAVSDHQVRGAVMGENGVTGDAFIASADGANAGQGQAAVLDSGRGVVAFLVGSGKSFEIAATPIQCVEK